jgi:hypothetical protein
VGADSVGGSGARGDDAAVGFCDANVAPGGAEFSTGGTESSMAGALTGATAVAATRGFAGSGDELVPLRARPTDSQMTPTPTNTAKHTSATRT